MKRFDPSIEAMVGCILMAVVALGAGLTIMATSPSTNICHPDGCAAFTTPAAKAAWLKAHPSPNPTNDYWPGTDPLWADEINHQNTPIELTNPYGCHYYKVNEGNGYVMVPVYIGPNTVKCDHK